jgi:hypothetical protein
MKWFGAWQAAIWMTAVCLVLTACGGAMEESAEAPAESVEAATPELELEQPEGAAEPIEAVTLAPQPTPPHAEPQPTPDFNSVACDVPSQIVCSQPVQVILLVSPYEEDLVGRCSSRCSFTGSAGAIRKGSQRDEPALRKGRVQYREC